MTASLNHVAISVDPALMDATGRTALIDFFGTVFGWTEGDNTGETGNPLILYTGNFGEFVYLLPGEPFLKAPKLDHFGMQVESLVELNEIVARAKKYADHDPRVNLIDVHSRITHGPTRDYVLTSAYLGYVLPLMIEIQHVAPARTVDDAASS